VIKEQPEVKGFKGQLDHLVDLKDSKDLVISELMAQPEVKGFKDQQDHLVDLKDSKVIEEQLEVKDSRAIKAIRDSREIRDFKDGKEFRG